MPETPHDHFVIERHQVEQLRTLASRLFTENRMDGDAMRNAAQLLDSIVRTAVVLDDVAAPTSSQMPAISSQTPVEHPAICVVDPELSEQVGMKPDCVYYDVAKGPDGYYMSATVASASERDYGPLVTDKGPYQTKDEADEAGYLAAVAWCEEHDIETGDED